jgi:hypothetical protein
MRPPRVRFTVRRMMVVVAVVAVWLSGHLIFQRHAKYRERFSVYDYDSRFIQRTIWLNEQRIEVLKRRGVRDPRAAAEAAAIMNDLPKVKQAAEELERLRQKYESAMWHPWSLLEPDPSGPPDSKQ